MAAYSTSFKLACVLLICMAVVAPHAEAVVTCGTVTSKLGACIGYLKGGPGPSAACCGGIKTLKNAAATAADRQTACRCLKSAAAAVRGIVLSNAAGLPRKCGVSIPYSVSPSIDCSRVH